MYKFFKLKEYLLNLPEIERMQIINAFNDLCSGQVEISITDISSSKSDVLVLVNLDEEYSEEYLKKIFKYIEKMRIEKEKYENLNSDFKSININFSKKVIVYNTDKIIHFRDNFHWGFLEKMIKDKEMHPAEGYLISSKWRKRKESPYNHYNLVKSHFCGLNNIIKENNLPLKVEHNKEEEKYILKEWDNNILSSNITESRECFDKSKIEFKKGNIKDSIRNLEKAISIYPEEWEYYLKYIDLIYHNIIININHNYLRKAWEVLNSEEFKYEASIECLKNFIVQNNKNIIVEERLIEEWGNTLSAIKKYKEKLTHIRKNISQLNNDEIEFLNVKNILNDLKNYGR